MNEFHIALLWMAAMAVAIIAIIGGGTMYAYMKGKGQRAESAAESRAPATTAAAEHEEQHHAREVSEAA